MERSAYLVKIPIAQKQLAEDEAKRQSANTETQAQIVQPDVISTGGVTPVSQPMVMGGVSTHTEPGQLASVPAVESPKNTRFYMSVPLDTTRIGRDVQRLVEEVITHLTTADGTQVEVSLEVNVQAPDGLSQQTVRTVSENCRTLHIENFGFEE